ncbi:MAG: hypothetical protein ACK44W_03290 [Planctomycetota bacterium]
MRPAAHSLGAAALAVLAACGRQAPSPPAAAASAPPPELPALAEVPFPDWAEADPESFPPLEDPAGASEPLRWRFAPGLRLTYDFHQTLDQAVAASAGGREQASRTRDRNEGVFELAAGPDRIARVALRIRTAESFLDGRPVPAETVARRPPAVFECLLREDGRAEVARRSGTADAQIFFDALLAVAPGERRLPDGRVTTRRAGTFKVGPCRAARVETEFELAPSDSDGRTLLRGRAVGYFDLEGGRFVRASAAVQTSARRRSRAPEGGAWTVTRLDARTVLRLKLRDRP